MWSQHHVCYHTLIIYQFCHDVGHCVKTVSCSSSSLARKSMDHINGISYYVNKCQLFWSTLQMRILYFSNTCAQHSSTAAACYSQLHFSELWPQHPRAELSWLQKVENHTLSAVSQQHWRNQGWPLAKQQYSISLKTCHFCVLLAVQND